MVKVKVKCTVVQALRLCTGRSAHRGSRCVALLFLDHGTRRGWGVLPVRSLPPGKIRYRLYRRLGGPQGRSGQVRKISPQPRFDPQTVQHVASRYIDWATGPTVPAWRGANYSQGLLPLMTVSSISNELELYESWKFQFLGSEGYKHCMYAFVVTLVALEFNVQIFPHSSPVYIGARCH